MDYEINRSGWYPAALDFGEAVIPVSNYPLAYVYAMFQALSGHILGRRTGLEYAVPLYPNSYICLVGASGITHKSTAMKIGLRSLGDLLEEYTTARHLSTAPGLLKSMSESGGTLLVVLDEMASLLTKKRQDFASDLMAKLTELYDCPDIQTNPTKYDPITVYDCFLTLIAGSTVEWLQESLTTGDLMGGFGNRMTFVLGDPRKENPWPRRPNFDDLDWSRIYFFDGQVQLDENARDLWDDYYFRFVDRQKRADPFLQTMAERIPEKALKAAIVAAAWYNTHIINEELLEGAIDWSNYLYDCIIRLAPSFAKIEAQILATLRDGYDTKSKLYGKLSHSVPPESIRRGLENLKWLGMVKVEGNLITVKRRGK